MKTVWQTLLVLFFLFGLFGNLVLAQDVQGPKMVLKEQSVDLKEVKEGEPIEHTFQVFNKGDQVLEIKNVKPG